MNIQAMSLNTKVLKELNALKDCGVKVSTKALKAAAGDLSEYEDMRISEIADLLLLLNN